MPRYEASTAYGSVVLDSEEVPISFAHVINPYNVSGMELSIRRQYSLTDPARPVDWNDEDGDGQIVWGPVAIPANSEDDIDISAAGLKFGFDSPYYGDEYLAATGDGSVSPGGEIQAVLKPGA